MTFRTVFLSSTAKDLKNYRDAAYKAIESLDGYHCVRMEDFGARHSEADEFCCKRVAECDLFVCLVGHLYGSTPPHSDQAFTEREYQAAVDTDRSCLVFLAPDDFPLPGNLREPDDKWRRQQEFRARVSQERLLDTFRSPDDLRARVIQAIHNWEQENLGAQEQHANHRPAWQYPSLSTPHPYPLEANFTGRFGERGQISEWLVERPESVLAIIGVGGMGKSAMTWAWLQHDFYGRELLGSSPELYLRIRKPPDSIPEESLWIQYGRSPVSSGIGSGSPGEVNKSANLPALWWSFYERGAGFEAFLEWFITNMVQEECSGLTNTSEQVEHILCELTRKPYLLILDGFERELVAYRRCGQYRDEELLNQETSEYRRCALPEAGSFLRRLAASRSRSKVIVTSQFLPAELEGIDRQPLPGCRVMNLGGLDPHKALLFMQRQGVGGLESQIEEVCRWFDHHPLSLRMISGRIVRDSERPGDIAAIPRITALKAIGKEYRGVSIVYNGIPGDLRIFLGYMSALDMPVDYPKLNKLARDSGVFAGDEDFDQAIALAVELGLVTRDRQVNQYGMHSVVRAYVRRAFEENLGHMMSLGPESGLGG